MSRLREIKELTRVRTLLFLREPEAVFWVFAFPMILAGVLGFAFRDQGVEDSPIGILGTSTETEALEVILKRVEYLDVDRFTDAEEAAMALRNGRIDALITPGDPPQVQLDPVRKEAEVARLRIQRALDLEARTEEERNKQYFKVDPISERGSRYIDFLLPGLLGLNLMGTSMWSIGFAVADMRQRKVLKRMLVTPMRRSSFLMAFMFSRLAFLLLEVLFITAFGIWVLGVPFRSGILDFLVLTLLAAFAFSGLGLLTASRVKTLEGASGILNLVMMPMWLASGVFFSYERLPEVIHPVLKLLPLTALNDALRGLMLDGSGLASYLPEFAVLSVWGLVAFFLALKIFRWE